MTLHLDLNPSARRRDLEQLLNDYTMRDVLHALTERCHHHTHSLQRTLKSTPAEEKKWVELGVHITRAEELMSRFESEFTAILGKIDRTMATIDTKQHLLDRY